MANSYNGWTASPVPAAIGINTKFRVLGAQFPGGIKSGDVEKIFTYLITRLHNEVEPMMTDPNTGALGYGAWGYSYRANVNNPSQLSCHASGTAIDYNAPRHANGTSTGPNGGGGWSAAQYKKIMQILGTLDGTVRWLKSNDPMHFEIYGSAEAVAKVAATLPGGNLPSGGVTPTPPKTAEEIEDEELMSKADDILAAIKDLTAAINQVPTAVWTKGITGNEPGQHANELLAEIVASAAAANKGVADLPTTMWTKTITDKGANELLVELVQAAQRLEAAAGTTPPPEPPDPVETYTVAGGDTFSGIAKKLGVSVDALKAANPQVPNVDLIDVGQVLNVPK